MIRVILCSYNGEKYISKQIDSILRQKPEVYLCVFDDGSTDGTKDILKSYEKLYPDRITITYREVPTGSATKNFLLSINEAPESDYYMLSDQDDIWHDNKVKRLSDEIQKRELIEGKATPILIHSDCALIDGNDKKILPSFVDFADLSPQRVAFNQVLLQNQVTGGAVIFNKTFKDLIGSAIPEKAAVHDHWMAILGAAFGKIYFVNEALYDYRQHELNTIGAKKASFIGETTRRLGLGKESKAEIDAITKAEFNRVYDQAREFNRLYGSKLNKKNKEILDAFIMLPESSKAKKMYLITKYGFHFNNFYRLVGEYIFI